MSEKPVQMKNEAEEAPEEKVTLKGILIDIVQIVGTALILTFLLLIFIQPSIVDGPSMNPTLLNGDKMILWKLGSVTHNDIVVFNSHDSNNNNYVKRVVGIAGDHIVIRDSTITVNDEVLNETYINEPIFKGDVDIIVPEDCIYVLGDNRNHSNDSRAFGPVKLSDVKGKVIFNFDKTIRSIMSLIKGD